MVNSKKTVLLVEDDPMLIDIYTTKLKEQKFSPVVKENGKGILEVIEREKPDVIVLDIVLPYLDGWEILEQIKANEKIKDIPVIILSNLGQKEDIDRGFSMGISRYLIKAHHTPSEVATEIQNVLSEKS